MEGDRVPLQAFQYNLSGQCHLGRPKQRRKNQDNLKDEDQKFVVTLNLNRLLLLLIYTVLHGFIIIIIILKYQKLKK
jgi:hypothetical protein